jgi:deoxyribose-phosphate aldolase
MHANQLARYIDHTLLKPEATLAQVDLLCEEAFRYRFYGVCVNPVFVAHARRMLDSAARPLDSDQRPTLISVCGFPFGASKSATKVHEAQSALDDGASEIDMVIHVGALIAGDTKAVRADIEAVARVVHPNRSRILKVILETRALTPEQIILGCRCCAEGGADFVKTSTGFHLGGGATVEDVRLLHRYASPIKVKASGGIRTLDGVLAMIEAGAARIGTSSGIAILDEAHRRFPSE